MENSRGAQGEEATIPWCGLHRELEVELQPVPGCHCFLIPHSQNSVLWKGDNSSHSGQVASGQASLRTQSSLGWSLTVSAVHRHTLALVSRLAASHVSIRDKETQMLTSLSPTCQQPQPLLGLLITLAAQCPPLPHVLPGSPGSPHTLYSRLHCPSFPSSSGLGIFSAPGTLCSCHHIHTRTCTQKNMLTCSHNPPSSSP